MVHAHPIGGQWFGYFNYGPEYGPQLEGKRVYFSLLIEAKPDGQFTGTCIELEGIGASEEISSLTGFVENGFISFTKEYKRYGTIDENGWEGDYEGQLKPRLFYTGQMNYATQTCKGHWEMWAGEVLDGDGSQVFVTTGSWQMGRHAEDCNI
jgi:hypothetical protein